MLGVILAGGENRRLPFIKGFIEINGKKIIESQIEILKGIFEKVVISTNTPELYFYLGVPMIGDVIEEMGPMTGILSILLGTGEDKVFVTACDMPFIKPRLIRHIIKGRHKDATVPIFNQRPEPLLAVYSKGIISAAERKIKEGKKSLADMLKEINVRYIDEQGVRALDPKGRSFVNINTMQDLKRQTIKTHGGLK